MARTIVHVDLDAFYASVEQRDHPDWKGRPLAVGWSSPRGVVAAASYEARRFGIQSAMPMGEALARCPRLIVTPPRISWYRQISHRVREILRVHTALIEPVGLDEAYLDVSGSSERVGGGRAIALEIRAAIRAELGLTASAGIGPTKCIAKIASEQCKPDGLLEIRPDGVLDFLRRLPVTVLWGVGPVTARVLEQRGVRTVAQLATQPAEELMQRFGLYGRRLYDLARGIDPRTVEPHRVRKSVSEEETFSADTSDLDTLEAVLHGQAESLAEFLRRERLWVRTVTVKVKLNESLGKGQYRERTRSRTVSDGIQRAGDIHEIACRLLRTVAFGRHKVRLLGTQLSSFASEAAPRQLALFEERPPV